LRSLGYEEEHGQKVLAVMEGRGKGKETILFPRELCTSVCTSAPRSAPQTENPQINYFEDMERGRGPAKPLSFAATVKSARPSDVVIIRRPGTQSRYTVPGINQAT
jgi:hypothetical protein